MASCLGVLIVVGIILANAEKGDRELMGIGTSLWAILALTGAVLFWNVYKDSKRYLILFRVLRLSGLMLMIARFAMFRRATIHGNPAWLDLPILRFSDFSVTPIWQ